MRYPEQAVAIVTILMHTSGFHFSLQLILAYLAPPIGFIVGIKYLQRTHSMRKKNILKKKWHLGFTKSYRFHGNP